MSLPLPVIPRAARRNAPRVRIIKKVMVDCISVFGFVKSAEEFWVKVRVGHRKKDSRV